MINLRHSTAVNGYYRIHFSNVSGHLPRTVPLGNFTVWSACNNCLPFCLLSISPLPHTFEMSNFTFILLQEEKQNASKATAEEKKSKLHVNIIHWLHASKTSPYGTLNWFLKIELYIYAFQFRDDDDDEADDCDDDDEEEEEVVLLPCSVNLYWLTECVWW